MRYFIFIALVGSTIFSSCMFDDIPESKVPELIKNSFYAQHPGVKPKWEKDGGNYEAAFTVDGNKNSVLITPAGKIIETESQIPEAQLPPAAITYMNAHYDLKKVNAFAKLELPDGKVEYECEMKGKDILFDQQGNFISDKKD
jgi:hypothetical protein